MEPVATLCLWESVSYCTTENQCLVLSITVHLLDYNKHKIKQLGTCKVLVRFGSITKPVHFYVVSDRLKPILGVSDALNLKLTTFHCPVYNNWHDKQKTDLTSNVDSINSSSITDLYSTDVTLNFTKESIVNHPKYAHLFRGIGRFKCNPVHIMTKQNGVPIQKSPRKVPIVRRDQFKKELDSMEEQGIISKFDGQDISPEWLNSFVIIKKPNGTLRICLDPTDLNKEIVCPVCYSQTIDDVVDQLRDAKYFAVFDTSKGFFMSPLTKSQKC